ncbi:hypothetical protein LCGC14_1088030 [marine sediment metagenome]|uniref:Uncharacterized protein n=1 Tax=marine sediment metagenome TaxID=412755 RepID=A0A0F9N0X8_9ZZZZ
MKSDIKDKIIDQNTININSKIDNIDTNKLVKDLDKNLAGYLSLALRNTHYYGNLRIKYVNFNFTILVFLLQFLLFLFLLH